MTRNLCISVTLLDSLFHGKGDKGEPEWPPSPMRLFQALLAGSRTGCGNAAWTDAKTEAFRWLERRDPPLIIAPKAWPAAAYTFYVPSNDSDTKLERQDRLYEKPARPHRLANTYPDAMVGPTLHYVWAIRDNEWIEARPHVELLCAEARRLTALGWGIDQAVADGSVLDDTKIRSLPGQRWRAWDMPFPGRPILRVPVAGTLDDLVGRAYEAFRTRLSMKEPPKAREPKVFGKKVYLQVTALPPRPYAVFELPEGVAFRQEDTVVVAAMLRSVARECAGTDTHQFPGGTALYVNGDIPPSLRNGPTPPRFSYLPLPTIGHEHADGMLRRVLIAEPYGGDGSHAQWAQERLLNQALRDPDGRDRGLLLDLWRRSSPRMIDLYVGESRDWATVTPVILPGFDDGKQMKAERLFLKAVTQAGIPVEAIACVALRKAPFWTGARHPSDYLVPEYLRHLPRWHVAVRFREPIPGPLAIGVGRHVGLGVFAIASL